MLPLGVTSDKIISAMSAQAIRSDWVGRVIGGRFTLLQWLGGSGQRAVFLTELPGPQARKAVIKLIRADNADAESYVAGWAATRPLAHPHIMRLFLTGRCEVDGEEVLYAVMENADEILQEILLERPLTPDEAREMLVPVIDALSYLHGKGLVHGHIKPSNILVVDDRLKLSGDGLRVAGETGKEAPAGSIHDAPEAAKGTISPAGDLWSLGVTLVETLTQHPPVWNRLTEEDPAVPDSIPQPFFGIARGCLRADPMGRSTLDTVKGLLESTQPPKEAPSNPEKKAPGKFPLAASIVSALVVVAVVAALYVRSNKAQPPVADTQAPVEAEQQAPAPKPPASGPPAQQARQVQEHAPPAAPPPAAQAQEQAPETAAEASPQAPPAENEASRAAVPDDRISQGPAMNGAVVDQVMPNVAPKSLATIHGKINVRIRVTVGPGGGVSDATFESEGPSEYFAKMAMQAAQKWRFRPAQADGQAAANAWILQFQFSPDGAQVTPTAAQ